MKKGLIALFLLVISISTIVLASESGKEKIYEAHLMSAEKTNRIVLSVTVLKGGNQCFGNLKVFNNDSEIYRLLGDVDSPQGINQCWLTQLHSNGLDQLILETDYMSDGDKLYILDWNGKEVVNVFGDDLVQLLDVKDFNGDGNKELVIYARWEGVHIYEFDFKTFSYVKKDEKYSEELKKLNSPTELSTLFKNKHEFFDFNHPFDSGVNSDK